MICRPKACFNSFFSGRYHVCPGLFQGQRSHLFWNSGIWLNSVPVNKQPAAFLKSDCVANLFTPLLSMDTTYAYLAGTIDADGFISVGRKTSYFRKSDGKKSTYYVVKSGLSETSPIVPDLLHKTFPGWRGSHQPKNPLHKRWYIWQAVNSKAEGPLRALIPYLGLKRKQAILALSLIEITREQSVGRFMANPLTKRRITKRDKIYEAVTQLNAPRNRRKHIAASALPANLQGIDRMESSSYPDKSAS